MPRFNPLRLNKSIERHYWVEGPEINDSLGPKWVLTADAVGIRITTPGSGQPARICWADLPLLRNSIQQIAKKFREREVSEPFSGIPPEEDL